MFSDRPMIGGNHSFVTDGAFHGMIGGNATVEAGVELAFFGMVNGDLIIQKGARVRLHGLVQGRVINRGGAILTA